LASDNVAAAGFFVRFGSASLSWAQTEELSRWFLELRKGERPVVCHADELGNASYWLASAACDQLWLSPAGGIEGVGIAGQSVYLKGLLDRFKVKAEFLHMGRYKSAAETFTRDTPSEASIEAMGAVLASMRDTWLAGLEAGRPGGKVAKAMEDGPWDATSAKQEGLIDYTGYESEAREALKTLTSASEFVRPGGKEEDEQAASSQLTQVLRALGGAEETLSPHVAVLPAEGGINMTSSGGLSNDGIAADQFIKTVRTLRDDEAVKAVVLRIDSPGGSALASDLMWHELMQLRKKKPLIASVGGMAASGGYYLACASQRIFSERTSIVGSIGVLGGKIMLGEALAEYGVNTYTFVASDAPGAEQRAAYLSPFTAWNDETRAKVQKQMASIYDLFLARVAEGRSLPVAAIAQVAEGRIWSGAQGKDNGLVDELGGLGDAIEFAKKEAGLPPDSPFSIETSGPTLLEMLGLEEQADEAEVLAQLGKLRAIRPAWAALLPAALATLEEPSGFLGTPYRFHLQSLSPLLTGDTHVLAFPFAFAAH
jgi:protease-4